MRWKLSLLFMLLIFSGCAQSLETSMPPVVESRPPKSSEPQMARPPEPPLWVLEHRRGVHEYFEQGAFFGVGNGTEEIDGREWHFSADDKARNHLAENFRTFQRSLAKHFPKEGEKKINGQDADDEKITEGIQELTATLLLQSEIVQQWKDPAGKRTYSLARMGIEKFYERLKNHPAFSRTTQKTIKKRSDELLRIMEQERERKKILTQNGVGYEEQSRRLYLY